MRRLREPGSRGGSFFQKKKIFPIGMRSPQSMVLAFLAAPKWTMISFNFCKILPQEIWCRYAQNSCKGKRYPNGMPSDKKIILKKSASWFGFASALSLAEHTDNSSP